MQSPDLSGQKWLVPSPTSLNKVTITTIMCLVKLTLQGLVIHCTLYLSPVYIYISSVVCCLAIQTLKAHISKYRYILEMIMG